MKSCCIGRGTKAGWLAPAAILALLPKCPVCFAGYFAGAAGVGISLAALARVRASLIVLFIAALAYWGTNLIWGKYSGAIRNAK